MNETTQGQPQSFELPKPTGDAMPSAEKPASTEHNGPTLSAKPAQMPSTDPSQLAQAIQPAFSDDNPSNDDSSAVNDLDAHDLDVIEKQWVNRAKEIINRTSENPHKQKDELSTFAAEYLKKRYGKEVKQDK